MKATFTLGRLFGVPIGVHYTWLIAVALIAWTLSVRFFPSTFPGWNETTYWISGVVAALGLFASVLIHELAHSLVARARGIGVRSITLFIFGGVSNLQREATRARDEFLIAVVGPLTSIAIGVISGLLYLLLSSTNLFVDPTASNQTSPVVAIVFYLAFINILLGVFNLLPGFPLDGGRVLRSIIWAYTKSLPRATSIAATVGQFVAFSFIGLGVIQVLGGHLLSGIWIAFIGWFLNGAADASRRDVAVQEQLRGVSVSTVMDPDPVTVAPDLSVAELVSDVLLRRGLRVAPVYSDGLLQGIVTLTDLRDLPSDQWSQTHVVDVMARPPLHAVAPDDGLAVVLTALAERNVNQLLVLDQGRLVGLIRRADVIRYLQFREEMRNMQD